MTKQVSFRIDPEIIKKLKILAANEDKSLTALILEAIEMLFKKYKVK